MQRLLIRIFDRALKAIGPRHWWPGDSAFEIMLGAILTQNTSWRNVEKALGRLKEENLLQAQKLSAYPEKKLAPLIRSSGYFNLKAKKIKAFLKYFEEKYSFSLSAMKKKSLETLREELLEVYGIGPETADSMLLYALDKPSFVVDAYTRRIFSRHGIFKEDVSYDEMRDFFMKYLPADLALYNEYHALIVHIGHHFCRKTPLCEKCPLQWWERSCDSTANGSAAS